jgi:WD40 repeat protein
VNRKSLRPHLLLGLLIGCTGQSGEEAGPASQPSGDGEGSLGSTTPGDGDAALPAEPPAIALPPRGLGHEDVITEVWLDPRGSAALSLDASGSVRLWPRLPAAEVPLDRLAPIRVPIREPRWLSFARSGTDEFVIAALDTSQSARVIEIEIDAEGRAGFRERFSLHPSDPLLELHVLHGGDRLLALGVDHRLRLYDGQGKLLHELTEYGLAPWQLRFAGPPEALQVAMVLAGPTRIQRLSLADDRITRVGEPHAVLLDRGFNLNDLQLLPSGRQVAVLRRPSSKGLEWTLELHDFETGAVRLLWGSVASKKRPRLHVIDDERALLEDGSGKLGFWIDLRAGATMPSPFVLPQTVAELPPEGLSSAPAITLPSPDHYDPRQVSVVAGIRVVPSDRELLFDPIEGDRHHRLGHRSFKLRDLALDPDGSSLATASSEGPILVASLTDGTELAVACTTEPIDDLEFTDRDHLLLVDKKAAKICAWRTGEVVSEIAAPADHRGARVRVGEPGTGEVGFRLPPPPKEAPPPTDPEQEAGVAPTYEPEEYDYPLVVSRVAFAGNRFAELEPVTGKELAAWIDLDPDEDVLALDRTGARYSRTKLNTKHFDITPADSKKKRKLVVADRNIQIEGLAPSPDGRFVALAHVPGFDVPEDYGEFYGHGYYGEGYGYVTNLVGGPAKSLTMWSVAGEVPERQWSAAVERSLDLAWSADGSRVAAFEGGRIRVITTEGEIVDERSVRDFHLEELPDPAPPAAPAKPDAPPPSP